MSISRKQVVRGLLVVAALLLLGAWIIRSQQKQIEPLPESERLAEITVDGQLCYLAKNGNVYSVKPITGKWAYMATVFDPEEYWPSYQTKDGVLCRVDTSTGKAYPTRKEFQEDFENLPEAEEGLRELIGEKRMWTEVTLQSAEAPTVSEYVALRKRILLEGKPFGAARVAPSFGRSVSGEVSLNCVCPPCPSGHVCSKASLSTSILYFEQGDDLWFEANYYVEGKMLPLTLADFESDLLLGSPGIRLMLFDGEYLGMELKSFVKPKYRQDEKSRIPFPTDRWVKVRVHLKLDAKSGLIEVWQDGQQILKTAGITLPFDKAYYNSLEVGVSAHDKHEQSTFLYVDDVKVSAKPLE